MSDSLREQLLKAGFKQPEPSTATGKGKNRKAKKQHNTRTLPAATHQKPREKQNQSAQDATIAAQKKALKERIKRLIDTHKVSDHTGTVAYSYQVGNRLKQLFVTEACRDQLAAGELVITRLNGSTFLIPPDIGQQILSINPDWALHTPGTDEAGGKAESDDYAEHKIPDDLIW